MSRSLNTNVFVDGTWYRPGQVPPPDVAERIGNPKVWAGDVPAAPSAPTAATEPPRGGPGSSASAWRTFLEGQNYEVPENASAKDMQAAWDARNEG